MHEDLIRDDVEELMAHIIAMRDAKWEVERCEAFVRDAMRDADDARLKQANRTADYNAWVAQHPELALPQQGAPDLSQTA
jgi:hypothetical protein